MSKIITKEEYQQFLEIYSQIEDVVCDIVEYLGSSNWLNSWELIDDNVIIKYSYQSYGEVQDEEISIPIEHILNNTWEKYLKDEEERERKEIEDIEAKVFNEAKENRKKLYEELKKEFENED